MDAKSRYKLANESDIFNIKYYQRNNIPNNFVEKRSNTPLPATRGRFIRGSKKINPEEYEKINNEQKNEYIQNRERFNKDAEVYGSDKRTYFKTTNNVMDQYAIKQWRKNKDENIKKICNEDNLGQCLGAIQPIK